MFKPWRFKAISSPIVVRTYAIDLFKEMSENTSEL